MGVGGGVGKGRRICLVEQTVEEIRGRYHVSDPHLFVFLLWIMYNVVP